MKPRPVHRADPPAGREAAIVRIARHGTMMLVGAALFGCGAVGTGEVGTVVAPCSDTPNVNIQADNLIISGHLRDEMVRILVDTGASGAAVSPTLAAGLEPVPGKRVRFAGAAGEFRESAIYRVSGLRVGGVALAPFEAYEFDEAKARSRDIILGTAQMAPYIVDIDLRKNSFCLRSKAPTGVTWSELVRAESDGEPADILVTAQIGASAVDFMIFDTGAGVSTINESLLDEIEHTKLSDSVVSIDAAGVRKQEFFVKVPRMCVLASCRAEQVFMPGDDLSPLLGYRVNGIVGVPFMRGTRVLLDFPSRRIAIRD